MRLFRSPFLYLLLGGLALAGLVFVFDPVLGFVSTGSRFGVTVGESINDAERTIAAATHGPPIESTAFENLGGRVSSGCNPSRRGHCRVSSMYAFRDGFWPGRTIYLMSDFDLRDGPTSRRVTVISWCYSILARCPSGMSPHGRLVR